ncbi:hypothetical protein SDRG_02916 [Saprolegnia diclina VS20]|uniref:Uncharacterized protein n=1 Tax=Saprolegnia diclina (strain VS20) TaxID=1156394 RepID=T0S393_SAPDV|nr:hypothetical protein SDRG_02916 [Saprolegnia diclina VS20]EQC39473.1 hypothetical protein SDRG_02916 [Saprolegnia diclina VS20]|eukprot:XP_008606745.1 hypothetical protein SDRG_02916 [Saprolegnia diclina VS20]
MPAFLRTDLEEGSGEWQNIQSILRATFVELLESSQRQDVRISHLEKQLEQCRRDVDARADKGATQRALHSLTDDVQALQRSAAHRPTATDGDLPDKLRWLQSKLASHDDALAALQASEPSSSSTHKTDRRIRLLEDELRLIVPIIDGKADIEAVNTHLATKANKDAVALALKKRCKTSSVERELGRLQAQITPLLQHAPPRQDASDAVQLLSQRQQQLETQWTRTQYFLQKFQTEMKDTIGLVEARQSLPPASPNEDDDPSVKAAPLSDETMLKAQVDALASAQANIDAACEGHGTKLQALTAVVHQFVADIQAQVDKVCHDHSMSDRLGGVEAKVSELEASLVDVIQAMHQLCHQIQQPPASSVSLEVETAQLMELEALLACSLEQSDQPLVFGTGAELAQIRDQFCRTLANGTRPAEAAVASPSL